MSVLFDNGLFCRLFTRTGHGHNMASSSNKFSRHSTLFTSRGMYFPQKFINVPQKRSLMVLDNLDGTFPEGYREAIKECSLVVSVQPLWNNPCWFLRNIR